MAAGVSVDVSTALSAIDGAKTAIDEAVSVALGRIGDEIVSGAKEIVPVDSGTLQNSISILSQMIDRVEVGSNVEYASYVEFGTFKMDAQPYLGPQADRMSTRAAAILAEEIGNRM